MKKIILFLLTFYSCNLFAQDTVFTYGEGVTSEVIRLMKEKENFQETNNRLFSEQKYDSIISFTEPYLNRGDYVKKAKYNMLSANYFLGNKTRGKQILTELLSGYTTAEGAVNIFFQNDILALKSYFEIKENKEYVEHYIETKYRTENYPKTEIGLQLIHFSINDQWIRRNIGFNKYKTADTFTDAEFDKTAQMNDDSIYHFYQKYNRLLNESEVGPSLYLWQRLLLWHIGDKEQRAFFLTLIKKAVQKGDVPVKSEVDFILRSEFYEKGAKHFFETLPSRIEEVKKEYNLSEYTYIIP